MNINVGAGFSSSKKAANESAKSKSKHNSKLIIPKINVGSNNNNFSNIMALSANPNQQPSEEVQGNNNNVKAGAGGSENSSDQQIKQYRMQNERAFYSAVNNSPRSFVK